jgi:hypothetical protein
LPTTTRPPAPSGPRTTHGWEAAGAALLYTAVVVAITWPLAAHLTTHWPGTRIGCQHDLRLQAAMLAHLSRNVFAAPAQIPHATMFWPDPWALYYGEAAFGALPFFLPPFLLTQNPILALNVVLFGGVVGTATSIFAVARRWGATAVAAFVGGLVFVASPWSLWTWGAAAPNFTVLLYWPWIIHFAARDTVPVLRLGILLGLQAIASVYVAVALFIPYGAVVLMRALCGHWQTSRQLVYAGAIGSAIMVAVLGGHVWAQHLEPGFLSRTLLPPILGRTPMPLDAFGRGHATGLPLAALAVLAVGSMLVRRSPQAMRRRWGLALVWLLVGFGISLPRIAEWHGIVSSMPLDWLEAIGLPTAGARDTRRLGEAALIATGLLTAMGIHILADRLGGDRRQWVRWAIAGVVTTGVAWHLVQPLAEPPWGPPAPTPGHLPIYDASATISDWPFWQEYGDGNGPILELPISPIHQAQALQRAITHRRPILNGTHSYYPIGFGLRMRQACDLPDPAAVAALRRSSGVELIAIDLDALAWGFLIAPPYGCRPASAGAQLANLATGAAAAVAPRQRWEEAASADRSDLRLIRRVGNRLLFQAGEFRGQ